MKLTDEAVETVAGHFYTMQSGIAWSQIDPHSMVAQQYKLWAHEALTSLPLLTDDGAAAPPADKGAANTPAAESATNTAAPSSPHLRGALKNLVQKWQYSDGKGFRGFYEEVQTLLAAHPADRDALTELIAGRIHGSDHDQVATRCPGSEVCQLWFDAEQAASRVLSLIVGAS